MSNLKNIYCIGIGPDGNPGFFNDEAAKPYVAVDYKNQSIKNAIEDFEILKTMYEGLQEANAKKMDWFVVGARTDNVLAAFSNLEKSIQALRENGVNIPDRPIVKMYEKISKQEQNFLEAI